MSKTKVADKVMFYQHTMFLFQLKWTYIYIDDSVDTNWVGINGVTDWPQVVSAIWIVAMKG